MEITVEPTTDEGYIKSVFLNPAIYLPMTDDSCPKEPGSLMDAPIMEVPGFFMKALVGGVPAGVWWFIWKGNKVEAHTALAENCRGRRAIIATKKVIEWVFGNTPAEAITSYAFSDSPAVGWFCRAVGLRATSTEVWPTTRNGNSVDVTHYEIQKPI